MEECHMLRLEAALLMPHIDIVMCCGFEIWLIMNAVMVWIWDFFFFFFPDEHGGYRFWWKKKKKKVNGQTSSYVKSFLGEKKFVGNDR